MLSPAYINQSVIVFVSKMSAASNVNICRTAEPQRFGQEALDEGLIAVCCGSVNDSSQNRTIKTCLLRQLVSFVVLEPIPAVNPVNGRIHSS